ncbi:conserved hypothetical protein [Anaeromyxobacter sp. K]|uniref:hypothetical protein n=1 Tax=Anaeromyxobacter sp. (strain K) TaxID=447217 RepID=UPI00015F96B6|nr:hypothetical protein [Anaeromyxobacter sp. K]ACG73849.1 conserved hypothetical protein [Anaeromyxobacter sp. K]
MRNRLLALFVVAALPALAAGQYDPRRPPPRAPAGPREQGLTLSARLAYGAPSGDISDEVDATGAPLYPKLDDLVRHKVPIWLELGYRFNPAVWGGIYLELAPASISKDFCVPGRSCDGSDIRFGFDVQFHLQPYQIVDPWVGFGMGLEVLNAEAYEPGTGTIAEFSWAGFEFPMLEVGLDLALSPYLTMGPFVSWSAGQYTSYDVSVPGWGDESGRIHDRSFHSWFQIGVKGTLKL